MSIPADRSGLPEDVCASIHDGSSTSPDGGSRTPSERLTDDLLVEILSRVPALSLCRFKCVSKHWLSLIDHPVHRKKLPQTLAGFFYGSSTSIWRLPFPESHILFTSVPGSRCPPISTSFAYLPNHHRRIDVLDSCNGLLLCRWYGISAQGNDFRYVVCNPATERWVALPNSGQAAEEVINTRLGFDPAQSPHFHVFEFVKLKEIWTTEIGGVAVYSSETRRWVRKEKRWNRVSFADSFEAVFVNGHLYFRALDDELSSCVAMVDTAGETWINFSVPPDDGLTRGVIQCSQSRLHYDNFYRDEDEGGVIRLAVYVLDNYESKEWKLKHTAETSDLFGEEDLNLVLDFEWVAIHPECNLMFFTVGLDITLMCYNMDRRQVKVIRYLEDGEAPYLPYAPLYAELQSLHM